MPKLSLYVWPEFYPVHDTGLAFAVAYSEEHAKDLIITAQGYTSVDTPDIEWGPLEIHETTKPIGRAVAGGG